MPRKRRPVQPSVTADFAARVLQTAKDMSLAPPSSDMIKLSEALRQMIQPFYKSNLDLEELRLLVTMSVIAWNADAAGPDGVRLLLKSRFRLGQGQPPAIARALNQTLDLLCQRKKELFPTDQRVIVDFDVRETDRGYHIQAAGLIPPTDSS